ncbi:hypothetical protein SNOG_16349 [Parastagonospora nodorum SN15]|uniref:Uncharacterized protein n=1 Tax=Phaeosphaeria nodorum (strain SN15 / ATCC MYA-4574 / FGSC 10173) TaxID=321614 RepID=Q0TW25_PHANO|nr:hypothetical protein SNOG_16349 [Parastagonospora nodorum SN15]EAT76335.1 hypothetical protein SNOG_16349 [Parastagonospora nodorum SN15]
MSLRQQFEERASPSSAASTAMTTRYAEPTASPVVPTLLSVHSKKPSDILVRAIPAEFAGLQAMRIVTVSRFW